MLLNAVVEVSQTVVSELYVLMFVLMNDGGHDEWPWHEMQSEYGTLTELFSKTRQANEHTHFITFFIFLVHILILIFIPFFILWKNVYGQILLLYIFVLLL